MKTIDQLIDDAGKDSFPASDAPFWPTGVDIERIDSAPDSHDGESKKPTKTELEIDDKN